MKQTILIAGLGLIGGSIAKAIKQSENHYIIGYDISEKVIQYATGNGIVHEGSRHFESAAQKAEIIILAAPISETIFLLHTLNQISFTHDVIVTDVSSVKGPIMEAADKLTNKNITFIGGHPMAGSHKVGIEAAKSHLFENAVYVLTPSVHCDERKLGLLKDVLKHTNSKFIVLQPKEHDEMTGVISHFPHLIASSLVHQAKKWGNKHKFLPNLAAGGFRDITRIASSNPTLWQDIFYHNRKRLSNLLSEWIDEMEHLKGLIDENNKDEMISYLEHAKKYRDGLPVKEKGAIPSFYDLYVDIRDHPGALASVVLLLANKNISIKNIEILEIREGITGVLRLSFNTKDTQKESLEILLHHGYEAMIIE